jgi:chromosome segregation ATPase
MDMVWLMLALASLAVAYMLATFKKYRERLENLLAAVAHFSQENVRLQQELADAVTAKEESVRKAEESKQQIETNKGRIGELEDRAKNAKKTHELLMLRAGNWTNNGCLRTLRNNPDRPRPDRQGVYHSGYHQDA